MCIRDSALTYDEDLPVVCHPPCRAWGRLSHMATRARPNEKDLATWSVDKIREVGGILEHPEGSRLFGSVLPNPDEFEDEFGGFSILIDQHDFGHVAVAKKTKLYFCGLKHNQLPTLPEKDLTTHYCEKGIVRSICGNVKGTSRCTQYQREYTPDLLINFFEKTLATILNNRKGRK